MNHESYVNAERSGSRDTSRHADVKRQHYSPEDIARIDEDYAAEERRGPQERWWEEVAVGDELPPVVKGALTVLDLISFHMAAGWGSYGKDRCATARKGASACRPSTLPTSTGFPTSFTHALGQHVAEAIGLPAPYDVGRSACSGSAIWSPTGWETTRGSGRSGLTFAASTSWANPVVHWRGDRKAPRRRALRC